MELDERLRTERRGHFAAAELLTAATVDRPRRAGLARRRPIAAGARADLVTVRLDTVRTAGSTDPAAAAVFAATAPTSPHVVVDGRLDRPRRSAPARRATCPTRAAPTRDRGGLAMSSADRRHRRAGHQRPGSATVPLGLLRDAALVDRRRPGRLGRAGRATRRPPTGLIDAGGRRGHPGLRGQPRPPGLRRRPGRPSSPPGWPASRTPAAASAPRSPRPGPPPTTSCAPTSPGWSREALRQGTTTIEIKSGYGLTVADEARSPADRRRAHRRDHLPRRARRPGRVRRPRRRLRRRWSAGEMLARRRAVRAWVDVFCERGAFDGDQARAILTAGHGRRAAARGSTPTSSAPGRACSSRWSSARPAPTTAPT